MDLDVSDLPADYGLRSPLPRWVPWVGAAAGASQVVSDALVHRWLAGGVWVLIIAGGLLVPVLARRRRLGVHLQAQGMRVWTGQGRGTPPRWVVWEQVERVELTGGRVLVPSVRLRGGEVLRLYAVPADDAVLLARRAVAAGVGWSLVVNDRVQPLAGA